MENPEEILHSLEEFSKMKPKDIPRELEEYLCFVAKTGNPVYQWPVIKSLFREKLINVITEFYETCPSMDIPPCPNVEMFNYDMMKNFILEKLDTFAAAPFTVQRICELLTTPRKEYSRIDKYMRALEKNILVVSTVEPGRRSTENGEEGIMNGIETEHLPEINNERNDINIEDMDESPNWNMPVEYKDGEKETEDLLKTEVETTTKFESEETKSVIVSEIPASSNTEEAKVETQETVITCTSTEDPIETYVSIEPQETYQSLSEESNSNSSDSSSSPSAAENKETVPEDKEVIEEIKEDKIKPIEEDSQKNVVKTEVANIEPELEVRKEISEDTQFELITLQPEKQPENEKENVQTEEINTDTPIPEVLTPTETVLEPEEILEKVEEHIEEKKQDVIDQPTVTEIPSNEPEKSDKVIDNLKTEQEKCVETVSETAKTNDEAEDVINDIVETKEQYKESPMEVDSGQDKKTVADEPSSSTPESLHDDLRFEKSIL
ncbi:serine/threonine-protein phosphatase 4 regulatory subunit 2-like isoform X1 [Diorhabda sublineata]|uniref:serine/threonine-protein phosphatase 4 regulatory subunit 2-like isoform X1 n=1 Tax=Diorhabda sublineata TaxID=1163346 RepID=UPI0024E116B5|nr:serine/threonine-protein phosphatase 4 regulatory subunit 2-like isoform X1 [Diorhabda sublineata]XP_056641382.1 serine/threonine-protein phosphatase 4 regulatory subunit 2-like isoform X1 [Diorhabda sublineata]